MQTDVRDRRGIGITVVLAILLVPLAFGMWWFRLRREDRLQAAGNERNASAMLRVIAAAEEEFRDGDRDGNGVQDYWTLDVAGLSRFNNRVPPAVAAADGAHLRDTPGGSEPHNGYYFKALEFERSGRHYTQNTTSGGPADRSKTAFAFCAYPADYGRTGKWTFVINEKQKVYRADTGGKPVGRWLAESWELLD